MLSPLRSSAASTKSLRGRFCCGDAKRYSFCCDSSADSSFSSRCPRAPLLCFLMNGGPAYAAAERRFASHHWH